jgi:hypothetical protein
VEKKGSGVFTGGFVPKVYGGAIQKKHEAWLNFFLFSSDCLGTLPNGRGPSLSKEYN